MSGLTYGPNAAVSKLPTATDLGQPKAIPSENSSGNFGDLVVNAGKSYLNNIEEAGKQAEQLTVSSAKGEASRLEHVMALNNLTDTLSLGTEALKKATEAFEKTLRVLG